MTAAMHDTADVCRSPEDDLLKAAVRVRAGDRAADLSRFGWRDASAGVRAVCKTAKVSSLSLIISSRRAGPQ
ncbi:hypothetical protein [Kitasatospora griseola]|uniref:hypothetical protein n=1 Tax=Kitasatospora griseola TaxID=2064 RepID=UPI00382CB796